MLGGLKLGILRRAMKDGRSKGIVDKDPVIDRAERWGFYGGATKTK